MQIFLIGSGLFILGGILVWIWVTLRILRPTVDRFTQSFDKMTTSFQMKIQELEGSRTQMEGILQSMTEGVILVDPAGYLLLMNDVARQIFEVGMESKAGRLFGDAIRHPEVQRLVHEVLETKRSSIRELVLYAPFERYLAVHTTTCRAPSGLGALLVFHDITDLKRLEHIRREFVANVSHELKTPLTSIRGAVETLLDGALKDPQHNRSFVMAIAEESARLQRLVEDLLTLAHLESKQLVLRGESIDLSSFLESECSRYRVLAKSHQVSLRLDVENSIPPFLGDKNQLMQAIGNLLDNAIKYNKPGGQVSVRALVENEKRNIRIEVEDTGVGIPPDDVPRIFERFYRVDKARSRETGGTGLGLSIVKHVVEAHGGSVRVESRPEHGSLFILTLPLC